MLMKNLLAGAATGITVFLLLESSHSLYARPIPQVPLPENGKVKTFKASGVYADVVSSKFIEAQEIRLVNPHSKAEIRLSVDDLGGQSIEFDDKKGSSRLSIENNVTGTDITLFDRQEKPRVQFRIDERDMPQIALISRNGKRQHMAP